MGGRRWCRSPEDVAKTSADLDGLKMFVIEMWAIAITWKLLSCKQIKAVEPVEVQEYTF